MKKISIIFSSLLILSGCAVSSRTYTAEGKEGFSINCSGALLNWGLCEEKAGSICGSKGYDILSKNGENIGKIKSYNNRSSANAHVNMRYGYAQANSINESSAFETPVINRTMLIACRSK